MGVRDFLKRRLAGRSDAPSSPSADRSEAPPPRLPEGPDAQGFVAVALPDQVRPDRAGIFSCQNDIVAVFRVEGALYAIHHACTHEDGPLGEGSLDGCVLTCPYHNWRFDVRTGACLTDPARPVARFAVKESGGFIWVGPKLAEGSRDRGGEHDDGLETR